MHIVTGNVSLSASHSLSTSVQRTQHLEVWVEGQAFRSRPREAGVQLSLSDLARRLAEDAEDALDELKDELSGAGLLPQSAQLKDAEEEQLPVEDLRLLVLAILLETVTGHRFELIDPDDLKADSEAMAQLEEVTAMQKAARQEPDGRAGWGLRIDVEEIHERHEQQRFQAHASLKTEEGRELRVDLDVLQNRFERSRRSWQLRTGDAVKDPLVLDFAEPSTRVADDTLSVDLDQDGTLDNLHHLGSHSPYLVDDRDGDGEVTDGSELFGPQSGDGYAELRALDFDGNGFVDSADPAWERLHVWMHFDGKSELMALSDKGVGALYVGDIEAPFRLLDAGGERKAQQQAMSFWVGEDGTAGTTRRVDVVS